jgi:hypothetical protein
MTHDRVEGRDPDIFSNIRTTNRPDNTKDVVVLDSAFNLTNVATESTLSDLKTQTENDTTAENTSDSYSGTQSETTRLHTKGKPAVMVYYNVNGDGTFTVKGSMSEAADYRTIETIDTSTNEYDAEDALYFPWTPYEYVEVEFSSSSDRDVDIEITANR